MAKSKVAETPLVEQAIPLSQIRLTWTPERRYPGQETTPITIDGARLAWLFRMPGAQPPVSRTPHDELEFLELQLKGFAELLGVLSDGILSEYDEGAIFLFLQQATLGMVGDLQHMGDYRVKRILQGATVTIVDEPKAEVA